MASTIINANVQYRRGEHLLLDYSSLQNNYEEAMIWARDPYSNAAVGQFIYIEKDCQVDGQLYPKGPYVVNSIGENAEISKLSTGEGSNAGLDEIKQMLQKLQETAENNSKSIQFIIDTFTWAEIQEGGYVVVPENAQVEF